MAQPCAPPLLPHLSVMSDFPKWMLALAGISLLPVLLSPFYLFDVATQLLWLLPLILFFVSLDLYRRGYERLGIAAALLGAALTATALWLL